MTKWVYGHCVQRHLLYKERLFYDLMHVKYLHPLTVSHGASERLWYNIIQKIPEENEEILKLLCEIE